MSGSSTASPPFLDSLFHVGGGGGLTTGGDVVRGCLSFTFLGSINNPCLGGKLWGHRLLDFLYTHELVECLNHALSFSPSRIASLGGGALVSESVVHCGRIWPSISRRRHVAGRPAASIRTMFPYTGTWWGSTSREFTSFGTVCTTLVVLTMWCMFRRHHFSNETLFTAPKRSDCCTRSSLGIVVGTQWSFTVFSWLLGG